MTRLEKLAFDYADDACGCEPGQECYASTLQEGFAAGFDAAVNECARVIGEWAVLDARLYALQNRIRALAEEDAP